MPRTTSVPGPVPGVPRRTVLKAGAVGAAALGTTALPRTAADAAGPVFRHGVASGDPLGDAVLLWTRVTPDGSATPGSGRGPAVVVTWEVAADPSFRQVLRRGATRTDASRDHTVSVDVDGLQPYTRYSYRFRALGQTSPVGRTQTAGTDAVHALRLAFVSCANWTGGYFSAYRHVAARDDLDAVLHLGDYLYEYGNGADRYGPDALVGERDHQPAHEMLSLADYRLRFACYRADPDLALAHQRHPWIVILDDHEVTNDAFRGGAENHEPAGDDARPGVAEGAYPARKARASQAYLEWMPIREPLPGAQVLYRRFRFGATADLHVVDTRSYRDEQLTQATQAQRDDPARELLGPQQREFLFSGLRAGKGRHQWRLLGNQTVLAPVELPRPLPQAVADLPVGVPGSPLPGPGLAFNADQWDGYEAERDRLKALVVEQQLTDVVVLTGDIHSSWANDVPLDEGTYAPVGPANNSVMTEFVTTSITSDNVDEIAGDPGGPRGRAAARALETAFMTSNPHIRFLDFEKHGYGVLDLTPERAQFDWFWIHSAVQTDPRLDPDAEVSYGTSWQTLAGTQQVSPAQGPVGPRADRPRTLAAPSRRAARPSAAPSGDATGDGSAALLAPADQQLPATGSSGVVPAAAAALAVGALALGRSRRSTSPPS